MRENSEWTELVSERRCWKNNEKIFM